MVAGKSLCCICGAYVDASSLVIVRIGEGSFRIECPSPKCPLRELGFVRVAHSSKPKFDVRLSRMFKDWNVLLNGKESCDRLVRDLLKQISSRLRKIVF
ncbi:MAG: hypothetical protein B9J98_02265 [Candidatus Terraquivivens tikiterensis]|uniref:Uncharacterized protein n=1 Tax=Candidatus Terraquivivens tikiterensis TaxID=1980982 RepID=A0A2R7Y8I7_9ARCH|nr:MAG: hypothetical protein B9J98_02265 [Candidatus Terraquivivens tikiterensis]